TVDIVVVTFDPLALITEKMKVSKRKEKVVVSLDSEGSDADDFSELKKITALLAKAFDRRNFYSKLTNNNLRTSSTSQSANKKQEYVNSDDKKVAKKDDEKKRDMSKNPPYKYKWADKDVPVTEGSSETTIERFYKMMNELVRNQCDVTNHQMNVQFLLQLQPEWQRSQQAATRNRGKAIVNSPPSIYDQEPSMVTEDDEMLKDKEIDKLMALISLSFKKIYKPTNNNLRTSSNTKQADWRDDTDDELEDQELEAHYMYMAQIQEVTPDAADNSGPIFDTELLQKVPNNDNYNVFAIESEHPEQSKSVNGTYPIE
nr:hypothetical protein [Tanacetum cinerariifolium]